MCLQITFFPQPAVQRVLLFTIINDKKQQELFTFQKLETAFLFLLGNDLNNELIIKIVVNWFYCIFWWLMDQQTNRCSSSISPADVYLLGWITLLLIQDDGLWTVNPVVDTWFVDCWLWLLSLQVHEHLPIYASGIQEFQNRLDHLQIEQAKLAETLANDKRYLVVQGCRMTSLLCGVWTVTSLSLTAVRRWRCCCKR